MDHAKLRADLEIAIRNFIGDNSDVAILPPEEIISLIEKIAREKMATSQNWVTDSGMDDWKDYWTDLAEKLKILGESLEI